MSGSDSISSGTADPFEQMEALVESSLPLIFSTYDDAQRERMREPVVLLIDCADEIGGEIMRAWLGEEPVDDAVLTVAAETAVDDAGDTTVVFARPVPRNLCRQEIPPIFPYLAEAFDDFPRTAILVVVVAAGGAASFTVPFDVRPAGEG